MKKMVLMITLFFLNFMSFGQQPRFHIIGDTAKTPDTAWLSRFDTKLLNDRKVVYKKPAGFIEAQGMECFKDNPNLFELFLGCLDNQLVSEDGHFITFIPIYPVFTTQDSIELRKLFPNGKLDVDNAYVNQITNLIKKAQGDSMSKVWREYVTFYSIRRSKRKFNADTVIVFHLLKLASNEYYKGKYKYIDALFLQKSGSFINFYFFYDEEGKRNLKNYLKEIEGALRLHNPEHTRTKSG